MLAQRLAIWYVPDDRFNRETTIHMKQPISTHKHLPAKSRLLLVTMVCLLTAQTVFAASLDQLADLTGKVSPIVTLKGRDNFASEYRYDVSVRNNLPDPLIADSLIVVLDKITDLAGDDRQSINNDSFLHRFEVLGQDGETSDGKPFFRIPAGASPDLGPQSESRPVTVRLRNKDYLIVFTPFFKVLGQKRPPPAPPKSTEQGSVTPKSTPSVDKLIQLLIKKGVITEEEWRSGNPQ